MRIPVLTLAATLALSGCASSGSGKLAVCDGKHLRPANPYGTVLALPAEAAAPAVGGTEAAKPKALSLTTAPTSFGSC